MRSYGFVLGAVAVGYFGIVGYAGGGQSEEKKQRAACGANLRRLHESMVAYASDQDDVFPGSDWNDALAPYLPITGAVLKCPSVRGNGVGYALKSTLVRASLNAIPDPDGTPLFFDSANTGRNALGEFSPTGPIRHGRPAVIYVSGRTDPESTGRGGGNVPSARDKCRTNLQRVSTAILLYQGDNDDYLPLANWTDAVAPYANGFADAFRCPEVAVGSYGYAFNSSLVGVYSPNIDNPSATPLVFDSPTLTRNALSAYDLPNPPRHTSGVTAYLDGHVSP